MKTLKALLITALLAASVAFAETPASHQEETSRYFQARNLIMGPTSPEECLDGVLALENLLKEFPKTYLQADIARLLFDGYARVIDDPRVLGDLAEKNIALNPHDGGLYEDIVRAFTDKRILPEQALMYARKSLEVAEQLQIAHPDNNLYRTRVPTRRILLGKAYQLAGQPAQALEAMKQALREVEDMPVTAFMPPASSQPLESSYRKQYEVDLVKLELVRLYVVQKQWDPAYDLTGQLMISSVIRDKVVELWRTAYVGKFGSAEGISAAYASLKSDRDRQRQTRLAKARIRRPVSMFSLKTIQDEPISLETLKGKVVVVNFWAGWCGPCLQEMPQLNDLKRSLAREPVEFLSINVDNEDDAKRKDSIGARKAQLGSGLTYLLGNEDVLKQFGVKTLPYTCLIDPEGNIRYEQTGLSADFKASLKDQLAWLLGEVAGKR